MNHKFGALYLPCALNCGAATRFIPCVWSNWHFWLATLGIVVYASRGCGSLRDYSGLMWREYDSQGYLVYSFAESIAAMHPLLWMRVFGGVSCI